MAGYGFWIGAGGLCFAVAVFLLRKMAQAAQQHIDSPAAKAMLLYRSQLAEIDNDLAKGSLDLAEAERLRTEIQRRILEVARRKNEGADSGVSTFGQNIGFGFVLAALMGAIATYFWLGAPDYQDLPLSKRLAIAEANYQNRPTQSAAEASSQMASAAPPQADAAFMALIEKLRETVAQRPKDVQGLSLLARNEAKLGNFIEARRAYEALIAAKGDGADAQDYLGAAQAMIAAAGGIVTAEAEAALMQTLQRDPTNGLARYFSGLMFAQIGRPDRAFDLWEPLLRESPDDAPWTMPIKDLLPEVAAAAGISYTLPEASAQVAQTLAGPSAEEMQSAAAMSEEERRVMINTMVTGLEERLLTSGGSAQEWARLLSSLAILGETGRAKIALAAGQAALANDAAGLQSLRDAAALAGIAP